MTPERDEPRWLTYVPLDSIRPAHRNAKRHDVDTIAGSMRRFGFTNALQVDERTELLVGGHGRWEALILLRTQGARTPAGILVDDDGGWLVPVQRGWASRNDAEAEAYILMDNRVTELGGGYDDRVLAQMIENLTVDAPDLLDLLKYTEDDIEGLLAYSRDGSDEGPGSGPAPASDSPAADPLGDDRPAAGASDDDGLGDDLGMTDVPDGPDRKKVRCPECGWHFQPGDKAAY